MASLPFSVLPAVVVGVARGSLFPSREQSRSFVLDQISCGPRTPRPTPPRANGRTSPKRAAINRTTAVATADCNESAIHERAESRVFEMGVGVTCRKWIKKKSGRVQPPCHHLCILEFQYRSPIENHGHMRPSPSSAAGTPIQCTSTSTGPRSARGEGAAQRSE